MLNLLLGRRRDPRRRWRRVRGRAVDRAGQRVPGRRQRDGRRRSCAPAAASTRAPAAAAGGLGGLGGGLTIDGTVTAVDADSLTLTLDTGEEMTFALDDDTTYHEATDAAADDVAVGDEVSVQVDGGGRVAERQRRPRRRRRTLTADDVTVAPVAATERLG